MNIIHSIIFLVLCFSLSYATVQELCVADTSLEGPGGFKCKNPESLTIKDFVFSRPPDTPITIPSSTYVTVDQLPGLNGLGVSLNIFNMAVGGVSLMHSHAKSTELLIVHSGLSLNAGFISSNGTVYSTNLTAGDVIVIPQGLLHYVINLGESAASVYSIHTNERFESQTVDSGLFGNGIPTNILEKVTLLDVEQIKKLKTVYGGTN